LWPWSAGCEPRFLLTRSGHAIPDHYDRQRHGAPAPLSRTERLDGPNSHDRASSVAGAPRTVTSRSQRVVSFRLGSRVTRSACGSCGLRRGRAIVGAGDVGVPRSCFVVMGGPSRHCHVAARMSGHEDPEAPSLLSFGVVSHNPKFRIRRNFELAGAAEGLDAVGLCRGLLLVAAGRSEIDASGRHALGRGDACADLHAVAALLDATGAQNVLSLEDRAVGPRSVAGARVDEGKRPRAALRALSARGGGAAGVGGGARAGRAGVR
jgi:hypothetical protein